MGHERHGRARARSVLLSAITPKKLKWVAEWDYLPSEINNPAKMKRQQPRQNGERERERKKNPKRKNHQLLKCVFGFGQCARRCEGLRKKEKRKKRKTINN